jgi:hypothetical protein
MSKKNIYIFWTEHVNSLVAVLDQVDNTAPPEDLREVMVEKKSPVLF